MKCRLRQTKLLKKAAKSNANPTRTGRAPRPGSANAVNGIAPETALLETVR